MIDQPFVSVIVRTYNRPEYLPECLASIDRQDYVNRETVVVWNGGKYLDVGEASVKDCIIPRSPLGVAMNAGIASSSGDFLYVVDDDDLLLPGAISLSVEAMRSTGADLVFSELVRFGETAGSSGLLRAQAQSFEECLRRKTIPHGSSMYRRSFLTAHGLTYSGDYGNAEDYDFLLALLACRPKMAKLSKPVYCYRMHSGQQRNTLSERQNTLKIRSKWTEWLGQRDGCGVKPGG
jgi:glycosyltransferase involved in cell wall biosynthesis